MSNNISKMIPENVKITIPHTMQKINSMRKTTWSMTSLQNDGSEESVVRIGIVEWSWENHPFDDLRSISVDE